MNKKIILIGSIIAALLLIVLAVIYWITPAYSLPSFIPGFDPAISAHHIKHGIGAFILGLGVLAFGWFQSGKKSAK